MARAYLLFNAVLYLVFSAWCTLSPAKTAGTLGFGIQSGSGRSEYLTVYGGLQLGLGLFFLVTGLRREYQSGGLLLAALLYGSIVAFRLVTIGTVQDLGRTTYYIAGLELLLGIGAWLTWWRTA